MRSEGFQDQTLCLGEASLGLASLSYVVWYWLYPFLGSPIPKQILIAPWLWQRSIVADSALWCPIYPASRRVERLVRQKSLQFIKTPRSELARQHKISEQTRLGCVPLGATLFQRNRLPFFDDLQGLGHKVTPISCDRRNQVERIGNLSSRLLEK